MMYAEYAECLLMDAHLMANTLVTTAQWFGECVHMLSTFSASQNGCQLRQSSAALSAEDLGSSSLLQQPLHQQHLLRLCSDNLKCESSALANKAKC